MIGYLFVRLTQLGWRVPLIIAISALVRGSYHLYQGFGGFVGNLIMGVIFALIYLRWRRVGPLVVAHTLLDVARLRRVRPRGAVRRLALTSEANRTLARRQHGQGRRTG